MRMNKSGLILLLLLVSCAASLSVSAKKKQNQKPVYVFGVSTSFTDSITYRTDIQLLDSVFPDANKFLAEREVFSYQLKNYLEMDRKLTDRTCMIFFNTNGKKLSKELLKLQARWKKQNTLVQVIDGKDFKFVKPED